jgi:hypothetical protein
MVLNGRETIRIKRENFTPLDFFPWYRCLSNRKLTEQHSQWRPVHLWWVLSADYVGLEAKEIENGRVPRANVHRSTHCRDVVVRAAVRA